jgi:acyl carrier protein
MEIKEFISNFADQFENTDKSAFSPQTRFRDLEEWSSLIALSVIAMADEEYDVRLKGDDMRNANTVQDLYDVIHRLTQIDAATSDY